MRVTYQATGMEIVDPMYVHIRNNEVSMAVSKDHEDNWLSVNDNYIVLEMFGVLPPEVTGMLGRFEV